MFNKNQKSYGAVIVIVVIVLFVLWSQKKERTTVNRFSIPFSRFSRADSLVYPKTDGLFTEVSKVLEQKGMPADVFIEYDDLDEEEQNDRTNIALTLHEQFGKYYEPTMDLEKTASEKNVLKILEEASPVGAWNIDQQTFDAINKEIGNGSLAQLESHRQTIRKKLLDNNTHFSQIFVYPASLQSFQNVQIVMSTEPSRYLSDYALLEEYAVAQSLLEGNIWNAIDALSYTFRIAQLASCLEVVRVRYDAAIVRLQAIEVMQQVILNPKLERVHMIELRKILEEQREAWTPESRTWFGDRACGIELYHNLHAFEIDEVLGTENVHYIQNRWGEEKFWRGFSVYREADETFYLQSMQKIIDISSRPFIERIETLNQIQQQLSQNEDTVDKNGTPTEHFAATLLLKDVERLMKLFAQDESALNRALVAVLSALGQTHTNYFDPLTGKPYEKQQMGSEISISAHDLPRPFRVPEFLIP